MIIGVILILLLIFILGSLSSTYLIQKKQLENQERIVSRLDLLWKEINRMKENKE